MTDRADVQPHTEPADEKMRSAQATVHPDSSQALDFLRPEVSGSAESTSAPSGAGLEQTDPPKDNRKVEKADDGRWYVDDGVGVEFFDSWAAAADYLDIVQRLDARRESARWLRSDLAHARSAGESYKRQRDALQERIDRVIGFRNDALDTSQSPWLGKEIVSALDEALRP